MSKKKNYQLINRLDKIKYAKDKLVEEYSPEIEKLGYSISKWVSVESVYDKNSDNPNKACISLMLQPLPGQTDEISDLVLNKIRSQILPKEWEGYKIFVYYIGKVKQF